MTIENFLLSQAQKGSLQYISKYGSYNGAKYIQSSGKIALENVLGFLDVVSSLKDLLNESYPTTAADMSKLVTLQSSLNERLNQILAVMKQNPVPESFDEEASANTGLKVASLHLQKNEILDSPCSHAKDGKPLALRIKNMLAQITLNSANKAK